MKEIAIATQQMVMGGVEKSLLELIRVLLKQNCKITLFLVCQGGELYSEIPKEVRVIHIFEGIETFLDIAKKKSVPKIYAAFKAKKANRIAENFALGWQYTCDYTNEVGQIFDIAIAYSAPISFSVVYVDKVIHAKKKIVWIHDNVGEISLDIKQYGFVYKNYNEIRCVSKRCKEIFDKNLPEYSYKTKVFYNFINKEKLRYLAKEPVEVTCENSKSIILTVGRICDPKGQDIIPFIAEILKQKNINFVWYVIGDGPLLNAVKEDTHKRNCQKDVVFLGTMENPYPFFEKCDLYVQPSRHEGFGITIAEAKVFGKPIIVTNFAGSDEQITDGVNGRIVSFNIKEIANAIEVLLQDKEQTLKMVENIKNGVEICYSDIKEIL